MRVLVTGANGFVGSVLCQALAESGYRVCAALRSDRIVPESVEESVVVGDIATADWSHALEGVEYVVHVAARAHKLNDTPGSERLYMEANVRGTERLAEAAVQAGVRRFVYLSSIKVNGEASGVRPYRAEDEPQPKDAYGLSKALAERRLFDLTTTTQMQAVIIRPPLVYGPGVRANFLRLLECVRRGWPLPFGALDNRRSLVSVWNLCDLILRVLDSPAAAGRTWLVSDGNDVSTPDLIRRISAAMGRPPRLVAVPAGLLQLGAACVGRQNQAARLCSSLVVDIEPTCRELCWSPPVPMNEALARTVRWYLETHP